MNHGQISYHDPIVRAIDHISDVCGSTPAQRWLAKVQVPKVVPGIFGCPDDQLHPNDPKTLALKEAKRNE